MKKRTVIRLLSYLITAIFVSLGFIFKVGQKNHDLQMEILSVYSGNLEQLNTSVNNISITLEKMRFITTAEQYTAMAAQIMTEAEISKNALSKLVTGEEHSRINRFLSQVGNYTMAVSRTLAAGEVPPEDFKKNIGILTDTAAIVAQAVSNSQITLNNPEDWLKELDQKLEEVPNDSFSSSINGLEQQLTDYPTLVYDGPFSDHILEKEPQMLKDAQRVSESQAFDVAVQFSECDKSQLDFANFINGKIPAYHFSSGDCDVAVSTHGGYTLYMRRSRIIGDTVLSYEQALQKAKRYLEKNQMRSLMETYHFTDEGVCVINFAYLDGETVCYTDLIKVGVAMDTGEIMLYEASGYITNHIERAFPSPTYTADQARELVSDNLKVTETALALIPTDSGDEVRCYEFCCLSEKGEEVLVYIGANDLKEKQILILLRTDGGELVK